VVPRLIYEDGSGEESFSNPKESEMSQVSMTHHEYEVLNAEFGHRSTQFYHSQDKIAEEYRSTHNDQLPSTPFWNYITARYDIDPSRFSHYHPMISKWIRESEAYVPPAPPIVFVAPPQPPPVIVVPPPNNGTPHVSSVPEPSSGVLMAIAVISCFVFIVVARSMVRGKGEF
jgi:hypothetical protein